ncbi:MAG: helix-turn-helix domain-containing protein [Faecousia sp.]
MARDFVTDESVKNEGILDVFLVFNTARMWQKIRHSAADDLFRGSLVAKVLAGASTKETAICAGINSGLLYQWVRRYRIEGYEGLAAQRKADLYRSSCSSYCPLHPS